MKLSCLFDSVCSSFIGLFCWANIFRDFALDGTQGRTQDFFLQGGSKVYIYAEKSPKDPKVQLSPLPPPPPPLCTALMVLVNDLQSLQSSIRLHGTSIENSHIQIALFFIRPASSLGANKIISCESLYERFT
jgi:hypothetical protein